MDTSRVSEPFSDTSAFFSSIFTPNIQNKTYLVIHTFRLLERIMFANKLCDLKITQVQRHYCIIDAGRVRRAAPLPARLN